MASSPSSADSITIDRAYFETLVRRAKFHTEGASRVGHSTVTVSQAHYDDLVAITRQHENLRRNLLTGGVAEGTLNFLCGNDDESASAQNRGQQTAQTSTIPTIHRAAGPAGLTSAQLSHSYPDRSHGHPSVQAGYGENYNPSLAAQFGEQRDWAEAPHSPDELSFSAETPIAVEHQHQARNASGNPGAACATADRPQRPQYDRLATRTLLLSNLPEGTAHADIVAVVRGGILLDVYVRTNDRSATVSFLQAADAKSFFEHVRRNDLYIKNKRVDVKWSDRQFILPGHVANKIGIGATRNLVIRRCDPKHTEESIREDLEHIHNLVVVKVEFIGSNCFIGTNSVHNAMFARTCMMSRQKYKSSKIEWDLDECAQSLSRLQPRRAPSTKEASAPKRPLNPMANRFQLLNLDDDDDDDDHDAAPGFGPRSSVNIAA